MNLQYKTKSKPLKSAQNLFIGRKTICNSAEGRCNSIYLIQESDYPSAPLWWFWHGFSQYCVYQCFTLYYCRGASCGWLSASIKLTWWWSGQHHTGSCVIYEKSVLRDAEHRWMYAHGESNPNRWNRNPVFYPLNYGRKAIVCECKVNEN